MSGIVLGLALSFMVSANSMADGGITVGVPDPASVFCNEHGGMLVSMRTLGGEYALCRLHDDSLIEEWTLFEANELHGINKAKQFFLAAPWRNFQGLVEMTADENCKSLGGDVRVDRETWRPTTRHRVCKFDDRSTIEVWTLFWGAPHYRELADLLRGLTMDHNGSTISISVFDTFTVSLDSNGTTGYTWKIAEMDQAILEKTGEKYVADLVAPGTVGSGGTQIFTFKALAAGKTRLRLVYLRPFAPNDEPARTFEVTVDVVDASLP